MSSDFPFRRRSIRLQKYDYAQNGAYFVTVCTQNRERLFGKIENGTMVLNELGKMTQQCWRDIPKHFPHVELDEWVVMPDHFHGIVCIVGAKNISPKNNNQLRANGAMVRANHYSPQQIWQRNYYEHVIRNEDSLNEIREYIHSNPTNLSISSAR